jgi:primase-polymerase (primpol)-like protein
MHGAKGNVNRPENSTTTIGRTQGSAAIERSVKPASLQGDLHHLPTALAPLIILPHWVLWRWEQPREKWTKVLYQPNGWKARNNDPKTWTSYDAVRAAFATGKFDGIGFSLLGGNIAAFDIDHCRDRITGNIDPWAAS